MPEREHFAASLGNWTASTPEGSITLAQSDSTALLTASGGATPQSAFMYRALPHTTNHLFAASVRNDQDSPAMVLRVFHKATAPVGDTAANLNLIELFTIDFATVSTRRARVRYRDTGGVATYWDDSTFTFQTSAAVGSSPSGQNDSAVTYGYQWDATNARVRFFVIGFGSGSSQIEACGQKLCCLTNWVNLSAIRDGSSSTLWITLGKTANDVAQTGTCQVEWTRIEDGATRYAAANQATVGASAYDIKLWESYGGRFWLPSGSSPQRTSIIVGPGTQSWCSVDAQMGAGIREHDGTLWLFFTGRSATHRSVGVTKSTDGGLTWTPYASNPIVAQVTGTNLQNCGNISAIKDESEPDPNKRYKLFLSFSDTSSNWRIYLYTASAPESTWTQEGIIAEPDGDEATGYRLHANPIYANHEWILLHRDWVWRGPRLAVGSLTKQASGFTTLQPQNVSQIPSVLSSTSRTVTVPDSTGFDQDAMVLMDDDSTPGDWAINRVRKNLSSTQFEMYERTPGYAPSSTLINRYDAGTISLHGVYFDPDRKEWCFYLTMFQVTNTYNGSGLVGANNLQNSGLAVSSHPLTAPTMDWFDTPQVWLARNNNTGTSENLKFFDPPMGTRPLNLWVRERRAALSAIDHRR